MKISFAIPLVLAVGQFVSHAAVVAHWNMDESGGAIADSSGNNLTGTPSATGLIYSQTSVPAGTYGLITVSPADAVNFGSSIRFTRAESGRFTIAASPVIGGLAEAGPSGAFTLTAWVNPSVGASSNHRIFSTGIPNGWGAGLSNVDQVIFTTYGVADMRSTTAPAANNVWQHLAYTWNAGSVEIFINGLSVFTATAGFNNETVGQFTIGGNANATDFFNGRIDELKIHSGVLSPSQIIATALPVPEPAAALLGSLGLLGLLIRRR